jgi:type 1 glutamine amidotransferase
MAKKALIVCGGWEGHEPVQVSAFFKELLEKNGFEAEISTTLEAYDDLKKLLKLHLIVPVWTGGTLTREQTKAVVAAVAAGVGMAGVHGGMCDAFRGNVQWEFMTGGTWVSHPGGAGNEYEVNIKNSTSPIVKDIKDFHVKSEQYYLHVDPSVEVLASTRFPVVEGWHSPNGYFDMPVVWTRRWGAGKIFYSSVGHLCSNLTVEPVTTIMARGFLWAARDKKVDTTERDLKNFF